MNELTQFIAILIQLLWAVVAIILVFPVASLLRAAAERLRTAKLKPVAARVIDQTVEALTHVAQRELPRGLKKGKKRKKD